MTIVGLSPEDPIPEAAQTPAKEEVRSQGPSSRPGSTTSTWIPKVRKIMAQAPVKGPRLSKGPKHNYFT